MRIIFALIFSFIASFANAQNVGLRCIGGGYVDEAIVRFNGTTGISCQNSPIWKIDDNGVLIGNVWQNTLGNYDVSIGNNVLTFDNNSSRLLNNAYILGATSFLGWHEDNVVTLSSADLQIYRDAADILAQRRSTNAQEYRLYSTYTDASNFSRLALKYVGGVATIQPEAAGTGTPSALELISNNAGGIVLDSGATVSVQFANRQVVFQGTQVSFADDGDIDLILGTSGSDLRWNGRTVIYSPADGILTLYNNASTSFDRLQFGGITSAFPALKRLSAILQARLADDSANAAFEAATIDTDGYTVATLPAAGVAGRRAYVTDQLTACPVTGAALTGGGAVACPVFDNGAAWVSD